MAKNKPLKKIVDHFVAIEKDTMGVSHQRHYDVLECGHMVRQSDTSIYRRRCPECNDYIVTAHISPDCSPETKQALGEMLKCLIEHIEQGGITPDAADGESWLCKKCESPNDRYLSMCVYCGTPRR